MPVRGGAAVALHRADSTLPKDALTDSTFRMSGGSTANPLGSAQLVFRSHGGALGWHLLVNFDDRTPTLVPARKDDRNQERNLCLLSPSRKNAGGRLTPCYSADSSVLADYPLVGIGGCQGHRVESS